MGRVRHRIYRQKIPGRNTMIPWSDQTIVYSALLTSGCCEESGDLAHNLINKFPLSRLLLQVISFFKYCRMYLLVLLGNPDPDPEIGKIPGFLRSRSRFPTFRSRFQIGIFLKQITKFFWSLWLIKVNKNIFFKLNFLF
jgi:hypothetical protein